MELFWKYIRHKRRSIAVFFTFCAIFGIVFALYRLPIGAAAYPGALCALLGAAYLGTDFARTRRSYTELERLAALPASMLGELPEAGSLEAEAYGEIVRALRAEAVETEEKANAKYRDMVDYYTVWAHQIKTPIAAMRLNLQAIDSGEARSLQADLCRIEQYVEMVLAFLRLDSETSDYVFQTYSLDGIIRGAVKKFSHEFIGRKLTLQYEPVNLALVTDEKWLSFVLEQLISNALKYTRSGGVKIYLQESKTLCIEDSGIGIAPEDLPRIFEKGYTGCNGRIDRRSSGIGLYLCKRVCDKLGIGISAVSEPGKGTAIKLCLEQHEIRE